MSTLLPSERRLRAALAANVRRLREEAALTLEEAAGRADLHWRHWQKLESGEVNATLRTLASLAKALATTPAKLLEPVQPVRVSKRALTGLLAVYAAANPVRRGRG